MSATGQRTATAPLTAGSLCTGYGGLDLAVMAVTGAKLAWTAETDRHAVAVLEHHWPGVPNLGDITARPGAADLTPHAESGVDTARSRAAGQPGLSAPASGGERGGRPAPTAAARDPSSAPLAGSLLSAQLDPASRPARDCRPDGRRRRSGHQAGSPLTVTRRRET